MELALDEPGEAVDPHGTTRECAGTTRERANPPRRYRREMLGVEHGTRLAMSGLPRPSVNSNLLVLRCCFSPFLARRGRDPADEQLAEQLTAKLTTDESQQARVVAEVERVEQLFSDDERVCLVIPVHSRDR